MRFWAICLVLTASAIPADAVAAHYVITIKDMAFGPAPPHLKINDVIEWRNADIFRHTATAWLGPFDLDLPPGAHAEVILRKPGHLNVFCRFHPGMTLRLTVAR